MLRHAILTLLLLPVVARADVTYRYAFGQSEYWIAPGGHVIVPIYFEETVDGGTASRLLVEHGLASVSVLVENVGADSPASITQIVANPLFDDLVATKALPAVYPADAGSIYGQMLDPLLGSARTSGLAPAADTLDPSTQRVLIGQMRFDATGLPGQSAHFQASMLNDVSDAWTWDALFNSLSAGPMEPIDADDLTLTIIPEPGTISLALFCLLALRRRSRA